MVADDTADPLTVAVDLLSQAEHGPDSPAVLVTTSEQLGREVLTLVGRGVGTPSSELLSQGPPPVGPQRDGAVSAVVLFVHVLPVLDSALNRD